jgi:lambda family phage minor tail protein L
MANDKIVAESMALNQSALITMYVLDGSDFNAPIYRFYPSVDVNKQPILWQGDEYAPFPLEAKGYELRSSGTLPTPEISFSNVFGFMSGLILAYSDLIGWRVTRRRTFEKFLDTRPDADPTAEFPDDVFYVERKTEETSQTCTFTLASPFDVEDVSLPRRKIIGNLCQWAYRSTECSFAASVAAATLDDTRIDLTQTFRSDVNGGLWTAGINYAVGDVVFVIGFRSLRRYFRCSANALDKRPPNTAFWEEDACGKRIKSCRLRFGGAFERAYGLPIGAFPAVEKLPF